MEDWRFAKSPYVEPGGLRAYAGAPLRLQDENGQTACLGSLCVASPTSQPPLTRAQQITLVRLADWVVSDLVQLTRARRQRARRKMVERMAVISDESASEERLLKLLQDTYPKALVQLQRVQAGHIEAEGRRPVPLSDLSNGLWEDVDHIERVILESNHMHPPVDRVVRIVAANCENASGQLFLTVGTKEFQFVFDDVDAWFVQKCASMISEGWNKRLLEEVMLAKENFLRGFSHQLRTPIHGILGSVELLTEELRGMSPNTATSHATAWLQARSVPGFGGEPNLYLDTIKRAGRDLLSIINSMITLNRWTDIATRERLYATYTMYELESRLEEEMKKFTSGDSRYSASVVFNHNFPPDRLSIRTDLSLLRDSLFPLIANAIQNTQNGNVVVALSTFPDTKQLIVDIHDTGCGIPQEAHTRIFKLYETTNAYSTGAGIGLTLSSKIAALLQGSVELVSSEVNCGSHFRAAYGGVDLTISEDALRGQPLVPQLPNLPRQFYNASNSAEPLSLSVHFSKFLTCYGFTASDTMKNTVVVIGFDPNVVQHRATISQLPPKQAIICLVSYPPDDTKSIPNPGNVVYVHGPFLTSTMSDALSRADRLVALLGNTPEKIVQPPQNTFKPPRLPKFTDKIQRNRSDEGSEVLSHECTDDPQETIKTASSTTSYGDQSSHHIIAKPQGLLETSKDANDLPSLKTTEMPVSPEKEVSDPQLLNPVPKIQISEVEPPLCNFSDCQISFAFPPLETVSHPHALLVDDNEVNLKLLKMYCTKRSLPFLCARDGLEAVSIFVNQQLSATTDATKQPIQLVLMDLQMPNCDGIEATRRIRKLEKEMHWRESLLFVVTGQDSVADREAACEVGGQEFCVEPVTMKSLDGWLKKYFPKFGNSGG